MLNNIKTNTVFDLSKRTALVTGGGTGLGFSIAKVLVEFGAKVIIAGRRKEVLEQACKELGPRSSFKVFDLAAIEKLPAFADEVEKEHGAIDILVNNAGIHLKKEALHVTDEEFEEVIRINQRAVFALTREITKRMAVRKEGCVIMVSSMAAIYGIPQVIAYTAAKSAVEGMTRALAVELSPLGIRVNCIAPGFIETEMSSKALDNDTERKNRVLARTPMRHLGKPEDVGYAAAFLASKGAAYITGVTLPVDGGNSIGF